MKNYIVLIILIVVVLAAGAFLLNNNRNNENFQTTPGTNVQSNSPSNNDTQSESGVDNTQSTPDTTDILVLNNTPTMYTEFTKESYDKAVSENKIIYLEFYATWCPTCRAQEPGIIKGLSTLNKSDIVAFRVNYKDEETDAYEQHLADKHKVKYQHTKVVIKNGEEVLNELSVWNDQQVVDNLSKI